VALEGLLVRGELQVLALFDKPDPLDGPYFEETLYVTPSRKSGDIQEQVADLAQQGVRALGLQHGPVHIELRINDQGIWLIEIAARTIGGRCARTLRFATDTTLEEIVLRHAAGLPIPTLQREDRAAGVMMLPVPRRGRLVEIRGIEEARCLTSIEDIQITIPKGQPVIPQRARVGQIRWRQGFRSCSTARSIRASRAMAAKSPCSSTRTAKRMCKWEASGSSGHYEIRVVSKAFADKSTLEKQRWSMERLRL